MTKNKKDNLLEDEIKTDEIDVQDNSMQTTVQEESLQTPQVIKQSEVITPEIEPQQVQTAQYEPVQAVQNLSQDAVQNIVQSEVEPVLQDTLAYEMPTINSKNDAESALADYGYLQSDEVTSAKEALEEYYKEKPDEYNSSYQEQIDKLLDDILNREAFEYDFNADPLYQQYKNQYQHEGMLAMQDTMANLQSATGGYGSSYAAAAGSGAYQSYLNKAQANIPELYSLAMGVYQDEGEQMQDALAGFTEQEKNAQDAYQTLIDNYYKELDVRTDAADSAYDKDYGQFQDNQSYLEDLRDYYAGQEQQVVNNEAARLEFELAIRKYEESVRQWEAEQAAKQAQWQAEFDADQARFAAELASKASSSSSGSSSSSSSSSDNTNSTTSQSGGDSPLSTSAQNVKDELFREVRLLDAGAGGLGTSNSERSDLIEKYLDRAKISGSITNDEKKLIAQSFGVYL